MKEVLEIIITENSAHITLKNNNSDKRTLINHNPVPPVNEPDDGG